MLKFKSRSHLWLLFPGIPRAVYQQGQLALEFLFKVWQLNTTPTDMPLVVTTYYHLSPELPQEPKTALSASAERYVFPHLKSFGDFHLYSEQKLKLKFSPWSSLWLLLQLHFSSLNSLAGFQTLQCLCFFSTLILAVPLAWEASPLDWHKPTLVFITGVSAQIQLFSKEPTSLSL